ncbi:hypothetical protein GEV33_005731 [Tenebrio molitor]|uniref:Uncharacterized protein n=1 Tax=Tenebrio molitor TaxID=7067 RepID=A0A8J6HDZ0_TENMO|nr:hypothetical protein GEV33_005731 [Tenebrio molitor]
MLKMNLTQLDNVSVGKIITLITRDVNEFDIFLYYTTLLWCESLRFVITCYVVYVEIGPLVAMLVGLFCLIILIQVALAKILASMKVKTLKKTDLRYQATKEMLDAIATVKCYIWGNSYGKKVSKIRAKNSSTTLIQPEPHHLGLAWSKVKCKEEDGVVEDDVKETTNLISGKRIEGNIYEEKAALFKRSLEFAFRTGTRIESEVTSVGRILEYTEQTQEHRDGVLVEGWPQRGEIKFSNVYLSYDSDNSVLHNFNCTLEPQDTIAIVGRTAAGKSSIISTILRLHKFEGKIFIDGIDIATLPLETLRSNVAVISQDPALFTGTVRENIDFSRKYGDAEIWNALKVVNLDILFSSLDNKISTMNSNLSLGQKQLLCLARAIIRKSKIVIMDEVTASVDQKTEEMIHKIVLEELACCTVIMITHKLDYVLEYDKVIVLDKGGIVEFDLYVEIGLLVAILVGLFCVIISIQVALAKILASMKVKTLKKTDLRYQATKEMLDAIATIKCYIWGDSYQKKVSKIRTTIDAQLASKHKNDEELPAKIILSNVDVFSRDHKILENINCEINNGLTVITGSTASGKTLLLKVILEEYPSIAGVLNVSGTISYASQQPWLFASTIKQNVLFGGKYNEERYLQVLQACALLHDLQSLPGGDGYIVADRGENLSKGQQSRINLARAVYRDCEIYLLDDCLANLDVFVADYIFEKCIKQFLKNKLVVLVTQNPKHIDRADNVKVLNDQIAKFSKNLSTTLIQPEPHHLGLAWSKVKCKEEDGVVEHDVRETTNLISGKQIERNIYEEKAAIFKRSLEFAFNTSSRIETEVTSVGRILEYTEQTQEHRDGILVEGWPQRGEIKFTNVYLSYDSDNYVLHNLNFTVEPQDTIAIVGRTAAGKSSIISTILRLHKFEGKIFIDGVDITTLPLETLRSNVSVISQDPALFTGTVRENIDFSGKYGDAEIWNALKVVNLDILFSSLDNKISTLDSNLSLGQKQLLCLARAIIRKSKIVIMDEVTASVDQKTEKMIHKIVLEELACCTVIMITHKLDYVLEYDKVIVLDKGETVNFMQTSKSVQACVMGPQGSPCWAPTKEEIK